MRFRNRRLGSGRIVLAAVATLVAPAIPAAIGEDQPDEEFQELERWAQELGAAEYEVRESAFESLWKAGKRALPVLLEAARSNDLETARRAERLVPLIRWGIGPDMPGELASTLLEYEGADPLHRLEIVREIADRGAREALGFLRAVLENEEAVAPWNVAFGAAQVLEASEPTPWLLDLAERGDVRGPAYRHVGAVYVREGSAVVPEERLARIARTVIAREGGIGLDEAYAHLAAALLVASEDALATELYEAGHAASGRSLEYRRVVARRFLEVDRTARAREVSFQDNAEIPGAVDFVGASLATRQVEEARSLTADVLARPAVDDATRDRLATMFATALEYVDAERILATMASPPAELVRRVARGRLDPVAGTDLLRRTFEEALARDREHSPVWWPPLAAFVEEALFFGEGEIALAILSEHEQGLADQPGFAPLAMRAALAAGETVRAADYARRIVPDHPFQAPEVTARFEALACEGTADEALLAAASPTASEPRALDARLRAYARTGDVRILALGSDPAAGFTSRAQAFDLPYRRGVLAEREGRAGEALFEYCRALAEVGSVPNTRLVWHGREVSRKAAYLARVDGALLDALARAAALEDPRGRARVRGQILRQTGDLAGAREVYAEILAPIEGDVQDYEPLDAVWTLVRSGAPGDAEKFLALYRESGRRTTAGRIALHLSVLAARGAGNEEQALLFEKELFERPVDGEVAYPTAFFLTCRGEDARARDEWESILDLHELGDGYPLFLQNAFEYLPWVLPGTLDTLDTLGAVEFARRPLLTLTGLAACWEHRYNIIERGGEPRYLAQIESGLAELAFAASDREAAIGHLRRAVGHDFHDIPAARRLHGVATEMGRTELASRAARLWLAEAATGATLEPANPEAHHGHALALEAAGDMAGALAAARRAVGLADDERYRALVSRLESQE